MTTLHATLAPSDPPRHAPRARWWIWPTIIVGFLVSQIVLSFASLYFALKDPASSAVEPDYYAKGLGYDRQLAQRRRLETLGWQPSLAISQAAGNPPHRWLSLKLLDRAGAPVEGAAIQVVAFAHAQANDRRQLTLAEAPGLSGDYTVDLPTPQSGLWEFRFSFNHGPQTATWTTQQILTTEPLRHREENK